MTRIRIIRTEDGSNSLFNEELNETYHSIHGAVQESAHVFIKHGLEFLLETKKDIKILEIGFGTGLNALLTLRQVCNKKCSVHYSGIEAYPVTESIWMNLNYGETLNEKERFKNLHLVEWSQWSEIASDFHLKKIKSTLQEVELDKDSYDLVYFDAFAPDKQPGMWELPMLKKIAEAMSDQSVFVTYCAKGQLKRDLKELGLIVESLPGPPGKREVIRAIKKQGTVEE